MMENDSKDGKWGQKMTRTENEDGKRGRIMTTLTEKDRKWGRKTIIRVTRTRTENDNEDENRKWQRWRGQGQKTTTMRTENDKDDTMENDNKGDEDEDGKRWGRCTLRRRLDMVHHILSKYAFVSDIPSSIWLEFNSYASFLLLTQKDASFLLHVQKEVFAKSVFSKTVWPKFFKTCNLFLEGPELLMSWSVSDFVQEFWKRPAYPQYCLIEKWKLTISFLRIEIKPIGSLVIRAFRWYAAMYHFGDTSVHIDVFNKFQSSQLRKLASHYFRSL